LFYEVIFLKKKFHQGFKVKRPASKKREEKTRKKPDYKVDENVRCLVES
jgi:hypothetical protein